jgi:superfamily I DNA/RNA helicase
MKASSIEELRDKLTAYEEREVARLIKKNKKDSAASLSDKIETINVFISEMKENNRTPAKLIENINKLFNMDKLNDKQMLCLSTIHKSKGGEWRTVFFLDSHLVPSKWATDPESLKQEYNMKYVAITRAINKLVYIETNGYDEQNKFSLDVCKEKTCI